MATVKKSKKKIIVPICIVLVIAIASGSIFALAQSKKVKEVQLHTITTDDIIETVSLTGEVSAGTTKEYKVGTTAKVKDVYVEVGDTVKKDDVLATFDVTELNEQINSLEESYNAAVRDYNDSTKNQKIAKSNVAQLEKDINKLEKKIKEIEKTTTTFKATNTTTTTMKANTKAAVAESDTDASNDNENDPSIPSITTPTISTTSSSGGSISDLIESITELNETLTQITNDLNTISQAISVISEVLAKAIESGNFDSDAIADKIGAAVGEAIIQSANTFIESGMAIKMVEAAVQSIDYEGMANAVTNSENVSLTAAEIQLASKRVQLAVFQTQASEKVVGVSKSAVNATGKALEILKQQKSELDGGWVAAFDGTITAVDIEPDSQTTLMSSGITLENLDTMTATISLSEYDVHKVKVGMMAKITTAYGQYSGEVVSIAPTATGGSSSSILDNVGSMAGISGLSSLTDKGAGVECKVSIKETDENIIAGFDADVEIETGEYLGVVVVPIESIKLEKTGSYVYLYNEEDNTVSKTMIKTGSVSDTYYEVISGLKAGDKIIAAPEASYEEDTFKVKAVNK